MLLAGARVDAATSQAEINAWTSADKAFGEQMWLRAEGEYARFIKKYPDSEYYAEAVLGQAQARCIWPSKQHSTSLRAGRGVTGT